MRIKPHAIFLADLLLLIICVLFMLWLKPGSGSRALENYKYSLALFIAIWVLISFLVAKYKRPQKGNDLIVTSIRIIICSAIVLGFCAVLMYLLRIAHYSRFVVFGTLFVLTASELIITSVYYAFINASLGEPVTIHKKFKPSTLLEDNEVIARQLRSKEFQLDIATTKQRRKAVLDSVGVDGLDLIENYAPVKSVTSLFLSTISIPTVQLISHKYLYSIINLERVNNIRYINKFFEAVNEKLPDEGIFIGFFESKNQRKKRLLNKYPPILNYLYYTIDFIVKRVFPKFNLTKRIYFILTRGHNRVLTKAEAFGRLYSCGFELVEEMDTEKYVFFVAVKTKSPLYPKQPSYGPLIKLKRLGKRGKLITVYKLRTMHPYSEFIQDYVYRKEGLKEGGKFKSDFRVSNLGKFFRMFWLDELPMILNLIKRDIKIVGVRPISQHYFLLYSKEHQKRRLNYKPGFIPPFYVDNPKTLEEIIESEKKYFDAYDRHPLLTDLKYFFKAVNNIIFKKARSA